MIKFRIEGTLKVKLFKEGNSIVAYSPALDLSTCGKTIKDAKRNFIECLNIYLKETIKHGTLEKDLLKLGWKPRVSDLTMSPPAQRHYKNIPIRLLKTIEIPLPSRV